MGSGGQRTVRRASPSSGAPRLHGRAEQEVVRTDDGGRAEGTLVLDGTATLLVNKAREVFGKPSPT
eukprot:755812-Pyramimonas_sp.AAC.1